MVSDLVCLVTHNNRYLYHVVLDDIQPKIIKYYLEIHINIAEPCKVISKILLWRKYN